MSHGVEHTKMKYVNITPHMVHQVIQKIIEF